MADTNEMFRQAVITIKENKDLITGKNLLEALLEIDPQHEGAWLWLSRTVKDPTQQLEYINRALAINPSNEKARAVRDRLRQQVTLPVVAPTTTKGSSPKIIGIPLTASENEKIKQYLAAAESAMANKDIEKAVEAWVQVLYIQADHPTAFPNAIRQLNTMGYLEDAEELAWRALEAGSKEETIPRVVLMLARKNADFTALENTYDRLAGMANVSDVVLVELTRELYETMSPRRIFDFVYKAVETHPHNQTLLLYLADLYEQAQQYDKAIDVYRKIVSIDHRSEEGKIADSKLLIAAPGLSDRERKSVLLAWREAIGIGLFYLLLAWQDAGLNLFEVDSRHLLGIVFSLLGGYLLVTGTSSPEQAPLVSLIGGKPDPEESGSLPKLDDFTRLILAAAGTMMLLISLYLVFNRSFELLVHPKEPSDVQTVQELIKEFEPYFEEGERLDGRLR